MAVETAEDHAGGDKAAPGRFSVIGYLDDVRKQGVDRCLHERTRVVSANLGIDLLHIQGVLHGHVVIGGDGTLPDLLPAAHAAKNMTPGAPVVPAPDLAPFTGSIGTAMEIGVLRLNVFYLLAGSGVENPLMEIKMLLSHVSPPPSSLDGPRGRSCCPR